MKKLEVGEGIRGIIEKVNGNFTELLEKINTEIDSLANSLYNLLNTEYAKKEDAVSSLITLTVNPQEWREKETGLYEYDLDFQDISNGDKLNIAPADETVIPQLIEDKVTALLAKTGDKGGVMNTAILAYGNKPSKEIRLQIEIVKVIPKN